MKRGPALAIALLLFIGSARAEEDSHTIVQQGRAFHPAEVSIDRGDTLTFRNQDDFLHQIYVKSGPMAFDSDEQPPGENVTVTFSTAGTFEVRCHIHPKMRLIVRVK
jgi:plastocyanin